uniref:Target of myb1 like 2 membrane trafficking protein n=1 Tax=Sus scrofa TaxID=9823 RepID=A0A8D1WVS1_PIG
MEFLLGNPFSTPVGQCLEKATDGSLQSEDWTLNMEICDIINETEEGPKDAIRALKKRLNGNRNYREVMLALTVLETCVKNCGHRFHVLVANRDFVDSVLVKVISPKNSPPAIVQDKVLALIQAWADAFRSSPDLTGVVHTYEELKRKGVEFPTADLDALSPIHTPQRSVPEVDPAATVPRPQAQPKTSSSPYSAPPASYSAPQAPALSATGPITANSEQIARLRSELAVVRGNTKVLSEMLTEMVPGQEAASDLELLQELHRTCRAMQQRVVELVSRVSNEEVTEELLRVNDDLNNVFLRYERFERYRSGRSVQNASNGVLSDVTEDNLIDLGPGSPAVVSPTVGGVAPPSSLSSQLAGLDLGTESVSGALSSLQQCDPRDSFDMFAQTRGSNSEPRKTATLEDPPATGVLSSALDGQKPGSEVIPVAQPSVMDDIEVWLRTDLKGDDLEEGVTSEEFDKFLEERAKAAEMVPSLPSPPAEAPASNPSGRKKPERSEDALFALAAVNPGVSLRHSRCSWRKGRIFISSSLHFMREGLSGLVSGHPPAWRSVTVVCLCQQWVWRAVSGSASIHPLAPLPEVVSLVWDLACNILPNKQTNTPSCVISVQRACLPDHLSLSMAPTTCAPVPFGHLGAQPAWGHWSELPSTRHSQPDCSDQGLWFFLSLPCPGVSRPEPPRRALEALGQGSGAPGWEVSLMLGPEPLPRAGPEQPLLADLTSHPAGSQG